MTMADVRRDNHNAFGPVFRQFTLLCRELDLFGRELLATDGTSLARFIELAFAEPLLDRPIARADAKTSSGRRSQG